MIQNLIIFIILSIFFYQYSFILKLLLIIFSYSNKFYEKSSLNREKNIIVQLFFKILDTHTNVYFSFCESSVESNLGLSPPRPTSCQRFVLSNQCEKRMYWPVCREPRILPQRRPIPPARPHRSRHLNKVVLCMKRCRVLVTPVYCVAFPGLHLRRMYYFQYERRIRQSNEKSKTEKNTFV